MDSERVEMGLHELFEQHSLDINIGRDLINLIDENSNIEDHYIVSNHSFFGLLLSNVIFIPPGGMPHHMQRKTYAQPSGVVSQNHTFAFLHLCIYTLALMF